MTIRKDAVIQSCHAVTVGACEKLLDELLIARKLCTHLDQQTLQDRDVGADPAGSVDAGITSHWGDVCA